MFNRTRTYIWLITCVFGGMVIGCASTVVPVTPAPISVTGVATATPSPTAAPTLAPVAQMLKTVQAFEDARKRGDTESLVALVVAEQQEVFRGKAEISAGKGLWYELADCNAKDDRVVCKGIERSGALPCGVTELQIDSAEYVFKEGKIERVTTSQSPDSYALDANFVQRTLLAYTAKNHPELVSKFGRMTREGGEIVVAMRKEYCAQTK